MEKVKEKIREKGVEVIPNSDGFSFVVSPNEKSNFSEKVYVKLNDYGFWKINLEKGYTGYSTSYTIPLFFMYSMLDHIADCLYEGWTPPENKKKKNNWSQEIIISNWAKTQTRKSLGKRIKVEWEKGCNNINPEIYELHKKLFAAAGTAGWWRNLEKALEKPNEYFLSDVVKYKAAAVILLYEKETFWNENWINFFSYHQIAEKRQLPTKATRQTITNLPGGVTSLDLLQIRYYPLPEKVDHRLKLLAYNAAFNVFTRQNNYGYCFEDYTDKQKEYFDKITSIIQRSSIEDIRDAIILVWKEFPNGNNIDFRRIKDIRGFLSMIFDYEGKIGKFNIKGLAKRSIRYHRNLENQKREEQEKRELEKIKNNKKYAEVVKAKTATPSIDLPKDESITFLSKYKDVREEGLIMGHCIASYAMNAVRGKCYLFHVDYNGTMASVEVSPDGYVNQSWGNKNTTNDASRYGRRVLEKWAKQLKGTSPVVHANETALAYNAYEEIPF